MRAGVETIRIMEEDGLLQNAAAVGAHLKAALQRRWAPERREGSARPGPDDRRGAGQALRRLMGRAAEPACCSA
jgi:acetylornithine aminotransferase